MRLDMNMDDKTVIALPENVHPICTKEVNSRRWLNVVAGLLTTWGKDVATNVKLGFPIPNFSNWARQRDLILTDKQRQVFEAWGTKIADDVRKGKSLPTVGSIWGSNVELVGKELRYDMSPRLFPEKLVKGHVPRLNAPTFSEYFFKDPENIGRVLEGVHNIRYEGDVNNPVEHNILLGVHKTGQLMTIATGGMVTDDIVASNDPLGANAEDRLLKEGGLPIQMAREDELAFLAKDGDMYHAIPRVVFCDSVKWLRDHFLSRESDVFTTLLIVPATLSDSRRVCAKYADKLKVWWVIEEIAKLAYPS